MGFPKFKCKYEQKFETHVYYSTFFTMMISGYVHRVAENTPELVFLLGCRYRQELSIPYYRQGVFWKKSLHFQQKALDSLLWCLE